MAKIFYDKDNDPSVLKGKKIGIVGYGSQGHAHALNLRDSGFDVTIGLHEGSKSKEKAEAAGLSVASVDEVAKNCDVVMILAPDTKQGAIYKEHVAPYLKAGQMLMFAHGFAIHFKQIVPPADVDVAMIAPKSPGHRVREVFVDGAGVPALIAVYQDASGEAFKKALAYGCGIGSGKAGILETTFKEETETDLFGEQAVLCGGVASMIKQGYKTLVDAGYQPEIAYFECFHELKLIVDLFYRGGFELMNYSVSDTAEWGGYISGPRVIAEESAKEMKGILKDIQDGSFAARWIAENENGCPEFNKLREKEAAEPINEVGAKLRAMMPWLEEKK